MNTPAIKFQQAIAQMIENRISNIHTSIPAIVETYDYKTQTAEVTPGVKRLLQNGDVITLPKIVQVPVVFPSAGDALIHWPINRGDTVLLIFSERQIDEFLQSGKISKPSQTRKNSLTDAIAISGILTLNKTGKAENNDDLIITKSGSKIVIKSNGDVEISGENIKLGSGVLQKLVNESFQAVFNSHTHISNGPGVATNPPIPQSTSTNLTNKVTAQ